MYLKSSLESYIKELESDNPYPGGGSASCLVGALGISLALMVGRIVLKKKPNLDLQLILAKLEPIKENALGGVDADVESYKKVVAAYGLSKSDPERARRIETALAEAYVSQKDFAAQLLEAKRFQKALAAFVEGSISSDLVLSGEFLHAAFCGAYHTAKINVDYFKDKTAQEEALKALRDLRESFDELSGK